MAQRNDQQVSGGHRIFIKESHGQIVLENDRATAGFTKRAGEFAHVQDITTARWKEKGKSGEERSWIVTVCASRGNGEKNARLQRRRTDQRRIAQTLAGSLQSWGRGKTSLYPKGKDQA